MDRSLNVLTQWILNNAQTQFQLPEGIVVEDDEETA
jgi:hypothetical protein